MFVVGLTGGIGSGKTTVANLFSEKGITIIDTDQLAREITMPGTEALAKIVDYFGTSILQSNGTLNRTALRKKIFTNQKNRIWLEQLLHPIIRTEMKKQAEQASSPYVIVVIPLLFETEKNALLNRTLVVDSDEGEQIKRTQVRDNSSEEDVKAIIQTQISRAQRLQKADDIIENHGSLNDLLPQIDKFHNLYLRLAKQN